MVNIISFAIFENRYILTPTNSLRVRFCKFIKNIQIYYRINSYSTAFEDVNEIDNDDSAGASVVISRLNDSVFTTQNDMKNDATPLIDVSQALINFDETKIADATDEKNSVLNKSVSDNLIQLDVPSTSVKDEESSLNAQSIDCSVISLSSVASQETNLMEKSITSIPSKPPDNLFDDGDDTMELAFSGESDENQCKNYFLINSDKIFYFHKNIIIFLYQVLTKNYP